MTFFKPPVLDAIQTRGLKDHTGDKLADSWKGWFANLYTTIANLGPTATGGILAENTINIVVPYTITTGNNASAVGPLIVTSTLTVPAGSKLVVS